jgi:RPA family protein
MIERELAWRVFAHEFNHSHYFFHEGDDRSPNYLVTPTGARINRLYFIGVLTEIENIGVGEDMWRGRVSDHTGGFMVYAGQYQPEAAMFISGLEVPSFVAVVGKARTYEPEEGIIYTSVRPEELNTADSQIRDRWIVETARLTFERIRFMRSALESGLKGPQLTEMLIQSGASTELADGINKASEHYPDLNEYLDTLSRKIIDSLKTLLPDDIKTDVTADTLSKADTVAATEVIPTTEVIPATEAISSTESMPATESVTDNGISPPIAGGVQAKPEMETAEVDVGIDKTQAGESASSTSDETTHLAEQPDSKELVYELLGSLDSGGGVPVSELTDQSRQIGLTGEQVDDALKGLMVDGRCYEPRIGILRRV